MIDWVIMAGVTGAILSILGIGKFMILPFLKRERRISKLETKVDTHLEIANQSHIEQTSKMKDIHLKIDTVDSKVDKLDGKMDVIKDLIIKNGNR